MRSLNRVFKPLNNEEYNNHFNLLEPLNNEEYNNHFNLLELKVDFIFFLVLFNVFELF